jgi:hypothetical protein
MRGHHWQFGKGENGFKGVQCSTQPPLTTYNMMSKLDQYLDAATRKNTRLS